MENPNYVLKTYEAVLMPKNQSKGVEFLKIGVWVVILIIVIGSLIFGNNLFSELSWTAKVLLVILAIVVTCVSSKQENVPSPMELQFYDDYLILYRPKRYYSRRVTRMEINRMQYSEITRCVFRIQSQRIHIYGDVAATWYDYDRNGRIPKVPTYNRMVTDTMCCFSTRCATDVDFKSIIEAYSPIRVIVEKS